MLELKREQRARLADTVADAGNIVFGAFVVGRYLGDRSPSTGDDRRPDRLAGLCYRIDADREGVTLVLDDGLIMGGMAALAALAIAILDRIAQRVNRKARERKP